MKPGEGYDQFLEQQQAVFEKSQRVLGFVVPLVVLVLSIPAVLLLSGVEEAMGISFWHTLVAMCVVGSFLILTTAVFRVTGCESPLYRVMDRAETWVFQAGIGFIIVDSGRGDSFFWFFYLIHVLAMAVRPMQDRWHTAAIAVMPLGVATWFWVDAGWSVDIFFSISAGATGLIFTAHGRDLQQRVLSLAFSRGEMQAELAELRVVGERARIARDLHDGVTADLTAMAWRAEELAVRGTSTPTDIKELGARARAAIDDTRAVVWALEGKPLSWSRLCGQLESRCRQLCSRGVELQLQLQPQPGCELDGALALDIVRMTQEAVRNAVQHAQPNTVRVELHFEGAITLVVEDDGIGMAAAEGPLQSGLSNLQQRVEGRQGRIALSELDPGTRVAIVLPEPP